jgi:hypothetical protein
MFTVQEHIEYLLAHGHIPWTLVGSPFFLTGLVLQFPFAAVAYALARLFVDAAVAIAERVSTRRPARQRSSVRPRPGGDLPRRLRFNGGRTLTRGPPRPIAA